MKRFEAVIGLEVHAQLRTESKLFCSCSTAFGEAPNSHTCEVCLGMPGVLPVLNLGAVALAVRAALGLGCEVRERSSWARKNYFYPDLPKGYQISQFEAPYAVSGGLAFEVDGEVREARIHHIHMEEDAGKNVHDDGLAGSRSYVDFNRGGTPLIEIVGEPDLRSSAEAAAYLKELRQVLRYLEVCDGNMEEGSLRCDANVSIREVGETRLGTRTELKNINSFRFVQQAIDYEIARQIEVVTSGGVVVQETRLWDTKDKVTRSMRSKEEAHDYRYFPDPDLPDLLLDADYIENIRRELPELPSAKLARYVQELGLSDYDARVLTEDVAVARFFEAAVAAYQKPKAIANWVINEVLRRVKSEEGMRLDEEYARQLAELVRLAVEEVISGKIAKELFGELRPGLSPAALVEERGLRQVKDTSSVEPVIDALLEEHPASVAKYREGNTNMIGFFVGQVMKRTGGKANPKLINELLRKKLAP